MSVRDDAALARGARTMCMPYAYIFFNTMHMPSGVCDALLSEFDMAKKKGLLSINALHHIEMNKFKIWAPNPRHIMILVLGEP